MEIHTQEIQELNLKSTVNFLKFIRKVLCAAADIATAMHEVNASEELGYCIIFMRI